MTDYRTFIFHVRTLSYGWSEIVMYVNDKKISFHASYMGPNPLASMIEACDGFVEGEVKYSIAWCDEPAEMNIDMELEECGKLLLNISCDYGSERKIEWHETVKFDDFVNAIVTEGFRVLNAFGLYGYRKSWLDHTDFPLTNLLHITGKCKEIWKGDACSTDIRKEMECLEQFLSQPEIKEEKKCDECFIYYESWQLQCCGDPFSVGDKVEWTCILPVGFKNAHGLLMDFEEEHHGFATHIITGTITKIIAERSEFPKGQREVWYDRAKCIHEELLSANGWESVRKDNEELEYTFWGYIVELKNVIVKPIEKNIEYGRK